jgi:FAD:protein FMN transferase
MDTVSIWRARPLLGTFIEIRSSGASRAATERAIDAAFAAIENVHRLMSFHDADSDVGRLNREAGDRAAVVDPWTYEVLETAIELHCRSGGSFDIAVAPSLQRLGLLPGHPVDAVGACAETATSDAIELMPGHCVRFHHPALKIDLGGIAKGFAVDRAIDILRGRGQSSGLVNAGGDLAVFGPTTQRIDIRDPRQPGRSLCQVAIANGTLASSARRFDLLQSADIFSATTIDPATGEPVAEFVGASVCAPSCIIADALTKIVLISGKKAAGLLKAYAASALIVSAAGDVHITSEWQNVVRAAA